MINYPWNLASKSVKIIHPEEECYSGVVWHGVTPWIGHSNAKISHPEQGWTIQVSCGFWLPCISTVTRHITKHTADTFLIAAPTLYGLAVCGAMGPINVTLIQCFVFGALIVAVDPVAVSIIGILSVITFLVYNVVSDWCLLRCSMDKAASAASHTLIDRRFESCKNVIVFHHHWMLQLLVCNLTAYNIGERLWSLLITFPNPPPPK